MESNDFEFSYLVPGDFSPNGLQKVFVSFYPDDLEQMKQISKDIFSLFNCAIYYHPQDLILEEIDLQDFSLRLSEMKLFVVIVTTQYLLNDSFAKSWEYGFAVKNNMPIIPIATEPHLEEFFAKEMNRIEPGFGDVQLLSMYSTDDSAIPYLQKLQRDLQTILVNDAETEKIRNAFATRFFLSYRKKDRQYANELMKSIHSISSLRNVSIWYDEFITIGENWNDKIHSALDKSDLFLLMVSPSIDEADNFVIKEEYPEAIKLEKTVVSVKKGEVNFKSVDEIKLQKIFPGLKILIDGDNVKELEKVLSNYISDENFDDEKDFLIGLAFFNGIDVEKDNDKAVSIIFTSAQKGFPDAIDKLSQMYWHGDGIPRNYENSIMWRKRLIDIYEKQIDNDDNEKIQKYLASLECLSSDLYELSSYRESLSYGLRIIDFLSKQAKLSLRSLYIFGTACDICSKNSKMLGLVDEAIKFGKRFCEITDEIYNHSPSVENWHNIAVAYERLGDVYFSNGNMSEGERCYQKSHIINIQINNDLDSSDSALALSSSCVALGNIYLRLEDYSTSGTYYAQAVDLRRRLLLSDDSDENRRNLGEALLLYGTVRLIQEDFTSSELLIKESKDVFQDLVDRIGTIDCNHSLSVALNRYGKLFEAKSKINEAIECYSGSISIRKKVLSKIRTAGTVFECALALYYRACAYRNNFCKPEAKKDYEEVIELLRIIIAKDKKGDWHWTLAEASYERFLIETYTGKYYLQNAIDASKWLIDNRPENSKYKKLYDVCLGIYKRCYPE